MSTTADVEKMAIVVQIKGKDTPLQVCIDKDNLQTYLRVINELEGGIKIIDKPICCLELE